MLMKMMLMKTEIYECMYKNDILVNHKQHFVCVVGNILPMISQNVISLFNWFE